MTRVVGVLTTGRWDYAILRPVLRALEATAGVAPRLVVTAAHLAPSFGESLAEIERDGFAIAPRIPIPLAVEQPAAAAASFGAAVVAFGRAYADLGLDLLLVLGDRWETHAAVCAATPHRLPIAHVHGGEVTEGALDELHRHAISKLSHLHFVAAASFGERLIRMGEAPWRVTVSGAPGLDALRAAEALTRAEVAEATGVDLGPGTLLVTLHPETQDPAGEADRVAALLAALEQVGAPVVFTHPNADPGAGTIRTAIEAWAAGRDDAQVVVSLGARCYPSALRLAAVVVGNSSSGIIEAATVETPVVNIGDRQRGRPRGANVIDVPPTTEAIAVGIRRALDPSFAASLAGVENPYGRGAAGPVIAERLATVELGPTLLVKRFHDGGEA